MANSDEPQIRAGDLVVAKSVAKRSADGSTRLNFGTTKDREYVLMVVGAVNKKKPLPTSKDLKQMLMGFGYISMDDVESVIQHDDYVKLCKKFGFTKGKDDDEIKA